VKYCTIHTWPSFRVGFGSGTTWKLGPGSGVVDPGCLSRIPDSNFFHPRSRVKEIPGSRSASKNLGILTQIIVSKLSEYDPKYSSRIRIPDPWVRKASDPGAATPVRIRNDLQRRVRTESFHIHNRFSMTDLIKMHCF
jgi:hypothetical protein